MPDTRSSSCMVPAPFSRSERSEVKRGRYTSKTESGYFDDLEAASKAVAELSGHAKSVYVTLNPVNPALLSRCCNRIAEVKGTPTTSDADIVRRRWILIDLDAKRPAGISAADEELAAAHDVAIEALAWLEAEGLPAPTCAESGNGVHLLLPVDLPADDGGLVKRFLETLAERFGTPEVDIDRSVHNPARITKAYGSLSRKGDHTKDRPHRYSRIFREAPWKPAPRELLERFAAPVASPKSNQTPAHRSPKSFDLAAWVPMHLAEARGPESWSGGPRRWIVPVCPFNSDHSASETFIVELSGGQISAGCHHQSCTWDWKELRERFEPGCYALPVQAKQEAAESGPRNGRSSRHWRPSIPCRSFRPIPCPTESVNLSKRKRRQRKRHRIWRGMLVLAVLAAVCAKRLAVEACTGWIEQVCLYLVVALDPGNRKSQVARDTSAPLMEAEKRLREKLGPEVRDNKIRRRALERASAEAEKRAAKAGDDGERDAEIKRRRGFSRA